MQAISSSEQLAKAENEVDILTEQLAICKQKNRLGLGCRHTLGSRLLIEELLW